MKNYKNHEDLTNNFSVFCFYRSSIVCHYYCFIIIITPWQWKRVKYLYVGESWLLACQCFLFFFLLVSFENVSFNIIVNCIGKMLIFPYNCYFPNNFKSSLLLMSQNYLAIKTCDICENNCACDFYGTTNTLSKISLLLMMSNDYELKRFWRWTFT